MKNYLFLLLILASSCLKVKNPENTRDYCKDIEIAKGEEGRITYHSSQYNEICFQRTTRKGWPDSCYIFLRGHSVSDFFEKGIDLKFGDGSKINLDTVIVSSGLDRVNGGYTNRSFFLMSNEIIEKIAKHGLVEYSLYINHIKVDSVEKYKEYMSCIMEMK